MKKLAQGITLLVALASSQAQASCTPDQLGMESAIAAKTGMAVSEYTIVNWDFVPAAFDPKGWVSGWVEVEVSPTQSFRVRGLTVAGDCND